ncbi:MAG: hypothetical protein JW993_14090 [Sedimentisphaerales bacterium]|nr:hypothetical protein [Sedimentisphaerales bacterium]
MKQSPDMQRLEAILRSSELAAGSFMGDDPRPVSEVIEADAAELFRLDVTLEQLVARMKDITAVAEKGLGNWVAVEGGLEACIDEARGLIPCPWPHQERFFKRVTTVRRAGTDRTLRWSDLSLHLIAAHGFFEGRGSAFRIEPAEIVKMLF